jgi:hypothetical protein
MKAKIKSGGHFLFTKGASNLWSSINNEMIINFANKYTYLGFQQKKNHLLLYTDEGTIDIVFVSDVPVLEFENYCKDQLILKVLK